MNSLLEALIAAKLSGSGGGGGAAVLYTQQTLTSAQQEQARANIGAVSLDEIGTVFTLKGGVATVEDLPASGNSVGDVYYVEAVSAGYIWLTSDSQPNGYWEELGETFDVTVDSELSNTSKNPVQNKTIALALNELHGSMDDMAEMLDSMIMLRTELTVDTTQDVWSGANWDELITAAKNGRAVSLGVDGADAQTVLLHYDELANSAEIKIIETEPKVYYYSTLAGAVSDSNAGTVGTNADASQGTAVVSLYVDENGVPVMTMTQNAAISAGLSFTRDAIFNLNGKKLTANLGNPESYVYAVAVSNGKRLRIIGEATGSAIEAVTGTGTAAYMIYCGHESYLEILGGAYVANAENTNLGIGVMSFGDLLIRGATISATAKQVRGVAVGSAKGGLSYRPNTIIEDTEIIVTGSGKNNKYGVDVQFANETLLDGCTIAADTDAEVGATYGIYLGDITGSTIIRNTEVTADSSYETDGSGGYVVLSTGVYVSADCTYTLLDGVTAKGTHTAASLYSTTDIVGGSYSSAGHGVYFSGSSTAHRVKGAEMDDLYVGTHTNTNQNHVGAYIGGSSGATGISVYADDTDVSGSNYSWVLRNASDEHDNALYISNSNINNKTIRIDDTTTLRLYLGKGNSFDANDTTRPANVVETGADYTFSPTVTTISYIGHPVTGSLTERDPGSVAIREISLKSSGGAVVTDYALVQTDELSNYDLRPVVVTVSGATPTITPENNTIYNCSELASLTISNPPTSGAYSIVFTSGATPTDLSVDPAIKMPDGFSVEANKRYEINVSGGWAVAGSWAVSA